MRRTVLNRGQLSNNQACQSRSAFCEGFKSEKRILPVFGTDVGHNVLIEELEDEWDTVGKHQVLGDDLKLQGKRRRQCGIVRESGKCNTYKEIIARQISFTHLFLSCDSSFVVRKAFS